MFGLKRKIVWLARIGHCRGFGVQSPWAYMIVRYVINEHYPYYAYEPLARAYPCTDTVTRKLRELCLRVSNHVQPRTVMAIGCTDGAVEAYVKAGCQSACYQETGCEEVIGKPVNAGFAVIYPCQGSREAFKSVAKDAENGVVVMLIGIHEDKKMRQLWREVTAELRGVVSFDLYYCGLVFFDKKRFKQNYIINF